MALGLLLDTETNRSAWTELKGPCPVPEATAASSTRQIFALHNRSSRQNSMTRMTVLRLLVSAQFVLPSSPSTRGPWDETKQCADGYAGLPSSRATNLEPAFARFAGQGDPFTDFDLILGRVYLPTARHLRAKVSGTNYGLVSTTKYKLSAVSILKACRGAI